MDCLFLVIPAYNESANIVQTIIEWYPVVEKTDPRSRLVIINDGSKDNTYDIASNMMKDYPQLIVIDKENGGHGSAVLYGYRYAIQHEADYIFQTDSDGQTNAAEFDDFWKQRMKYDAILGKRIIRGDGIIRKYVEKVVCLLLWLYFKVKVPDANAPFRLMKTRIVKKYIEYFPENYNLPNIMFTAFFSVFDENISFQEISFRPRQAGKNSINMKKVFHIGYEALDDFRHFRTLIQSIKRGQGHG